MNSHLSHPKYRPDIDGLRAIAVLSVVAFHAFPNWLTGGFIGVDVFFVISGYLISTIIFDNLDTGTFSFGEFYSRRVRRIFPALLLVLAVSFILGWFTLLTDEYQQLGKHIAGGASFISNFVLWAESGYFDNAAETKPLLHLWSLGIEEQFYIVYPLTVWLAWKKRFNLIIVILPVAIISFYLNSNGIQHDAIATFFSPQTRFWELMCGSLLAWGALYKKKTGIQFGLVFDRWLLIAICRESTKNDGKTLSNTLSFIGFILIFFGFFQIDKEIHFPGAWALVPVLGSSLVILAGQEAWLNKQILSSRGVVWFGLISFPLYLWHWVFLSFARIIQGGVPDPNVRMVSIAMSVALSWLTYRYIERPMRSNTHARMKVTGLIFLMLVFFAGGIFVSQFNGLTHREVNLLNATVSTGRDGGDLGLTVPKCGIKEDAVSRLFAVCAEDKRGNIRFALLGDSKAAVLFSGLVRTSQEGGRWLFIGGNGSTGAPVPMLFPEGAHHRRDEHLTKAAVEAIVQNSDIEVVALVTAIRAIFDLSDGVINGNLSTYDYTYLKKLNATSTRRYHDTYVGMSNVVNRLVSAGKKVILVIDNPALPNPEDCINRKTALSFVNTSLAKQNDACHIALSTFEDEIIIYRKLLLDIANAHPNKVEIFDPTHVYCDVTNNICESSRNGRLMYSNTDHISDYAAGLVGIKLNSFINKNREH